MKKIIYAKVSPIGRYLRIANKEYCSVSDSISISTTPVSIIRNWSLAIRFFNERDKYQYIFKRKEQTEIYFNNRIHTISSLSGLLSILF